jgi:hypothetical protein
LKVLKNKISLKNRKVLKSSKSSKSSKISLKKVQNDFQWGIWRGIAVLKRTNILTTNETRSSFSIYEFVLVKKREIINKEKKDAKESVLVKDSSFFVD